MRDASSFDIATSKFALARESSLLQLGDCFSRVLHFGEVYLLFSWGFELLLSGCSSISERFISIGRCELGGDNIFVYGREVIAYHHG